MALVGFDQDPTAPPGTGTFHFDDGRQLYARDPGMAQSVQQPAQPSPGILAAAQPGPDMRTAANGAGPPPAQRSDAGGPSPEQIAQLDSLENSFRGAAGKPSEPPATGGGPPPPPAAPPQGPPDQSGAITDYVNRPVYSAPTTGGYAPHKESQTVEQEGLPYSQSLAEQRSEAAIDLQRAHMSTAQAQAARAQAEALHYQAQMPELQKRAAAAQTEMASQQDAYKAERADLDRLIAESNANQKSFNANRWMESRGAVGQIGAVLAQAFGAYAATLSHGENWAKKIIDGYIDNDIANQKAQIESGKAGVSNALQKLQLRYGDMNQAQAALKIAMQGTVDNQIHAYSAATKSEDVSNAANEWLAQNQKDRVAEEQKFMAAAIGKRKTETSGALVAPSAGGYSEPTDERRLKRLGVVKEAQQVGAMPDTSREGRALDIREREADAKKKANPAIAKTQEQLSAVDSSLRNAEELDKLYAKPGVLSRAERGRMEYLQSVSPLEVHKALTGMARFSAEEGKRYAAAYGEQGETLDYTGKHRGALGALREDLARKRAQLQQQIASGAGSSAAEADAIQDVE